MKLVLTCEHGGNEIPVAYKKHFKTNDVLKTHRGYDLGALDMYNHLKPLADFSFYNSTSRLLVELNRSLAHKQLFSEFTQKLSKVEKTKLLENYYYPYRATVEHHIGKLISDQHQVLHISVHSFTPQLNGVVRNCDIGLLYDSRRKEEKEFCEIYRAEILKTNPNLKVRFNYPYLGKADGFTTFLRKQFPKDYLGIEIEINQKFSFDNVMEKKLKQTLVNAIIVIKKQYLK